MLETMTIHVDENLKNKFEMAVRQNGLTFDNAISYFMNQYVHLCEEKDEKEMKYIEAAIDEALEKLDDSVVKKHLKEGRAVYYIDGSEPEKGMITKEYPSGKKEYILCRY